MCALIFKKTNVRIMQFQPTIRTNRVKQFEIAVRLHLALGKGAFDEASLTQA